MLRDTQGRGSRRCPRAVLLVLTLVRVTRWAPEASAKPHLLPPKSLSFRSGAQGLSEAVGSEPCVENP